ncbi:MAG: FliG C-terminal domain-containing protein [Candidatus Erginobacter occultus]|nr:FliG C-terminal domain-containing protein [Candidatus Erginobacter occultus]
MARIKLFSRVVRIAVVPAVLFCLPVISARSQTGSYGREYAVSLENSLQSKLDNLIGPRRSIVSVEVTVSDPFARRDEDAARVLERLPGIRIRQPDPGAEMMTSPISSIHIAVEVDEGLPPEDIGTAEEPGRIQEAVARWARLNRTRGDTLQIIPRPAGYFAPPPEDKQSYILYSLLALIALLILIAAIYFPMRKAKGGGGGSGEGGVVVGGMKLSEEERKQRRAELEELKKALSGISSDTREATLSGIKELMELQVGGGGGGGRVDVGILEEIRDLLSSPAQESDALLTEMRDTLSDLLDEQRRRGGGGGAAPGAPAAAPGTAPAAAAASAGEGGFGGGGGGGQVIQVLGNLEELMTQQLERAPSLVDQPFKYIKSTDPEDIILLIKDEEPKLAAAVLSQLDPQTSASVFEALDEEKQFEMARAMTQLTEEEDMADEIKDFLERKLKIVRLRKDYQPVTGVRVLADMLSSSRYAMAKVLLEKMEGKNPAMAADVRKRMFLFEDIKTLEDKDVETLIHNLNIEVLAASLVDVPEDVSSKFLKNMTEKGRARLEEDMEAVKKVQIEEEGQELPFNEAMLAVDQSIIDEIFRTIDRTTLKMALRGGSEEVQSKFFSGLTERAAAMLKEDLTVMGGIPHSRAVEAQEEIMEVLRKLSSKTLSAQHEIIAVIRKLSHDGLITVPHFQDEAGKESEEK